MVVVPLSKPAGGPGNSSEDAARVPLIGPGEWLRFAAATTLVAGSVLLLNGKKKAGLITAAAGTAVAMIDQQETMRTWWDALPGYIDATQRLLGRAQSAMEDLAVQREKLRKVLAR